MRNGVPLWVLVGLLSTASFATQQPRAESSSAPETGRIYFSALNKKERPVLNLKEKDFELRVNGAVRPLEGLRTGLPQTDRSVPLVAWILIDFNPNINGAVIKAQASAAADVFRIFHPDSLVGVKIVSDRSETLAPLAHNPAALRAAFNNFSDRRTTLSAVAQDDSVMVGEGGIARAIEYAVVEIGNAIRANPSLAGRETHRAVMILSDGNINPAYKTRPLYENAGRDEVFLYPVYLPRGMVGPWIEYFSDLAKRTGGIAASLGAITPGLNPFAWSGANNGANALTLNFLQMARDLNGKYSFALKHDSGTEMKLSVKCKVNGVTIRLPRKTLP